MGALPNHKDMIHTMFGGNRHGNGSGWATLSKVSLLTGAANFLGGLPVLKQQLNSCTHIIQTN
jgi:hypothetical protein